VFDAALEFQSGANGRRGFRRPGLDRRAVRIVAMRAVVKRALTLPVCDTLSVGPKIPILVAVRMAAATNQVRFIEVYEFGKQRPQVIAVLEIMAGQTPDSPTSMFQIGTWQDRHQIRPRPCSRSESCIAFKGRISGFGSIAA